MSRRNKYISILISICFATLLTTHNVMAQYEGGEGLGASYAEQTISCTLINIYQGTSADGSGFISDLQYCSSNLFTLGGNGNGFSIDTTLNTCSLPNIYSGDGGDGYGNFLSTACPEDSVIVQAEIIQQLSCTSSGLGIATVSIIDGTPIWQSLAPFEYIWKNNLGDTLSGYPLSKTSINDTITNLTAGEYTVVVTDANGKTGSAVVYVNDCLYRGGEGYGSSDGSTASSCSVSSIFTNSGGDGFGAGEDYCEGIFVMFTAGGSGNGFSVDTNSRECSSAQIFTGDAGDGSSSGTDLQTCASVLFTLGGSGNGFSVDTNNQNCTSESIYANTGNDGFGFDSEILTCYTTLFTNGGQGNGFSIDTATQSCAPNSIYANSGNDGYGYSTDILNCEIRLFTSGGNGHGFSVDTSIQDCNAPEIYTGDQSDGYAHIYDIPCLDDSVVIDADVLDQITCPIITNNGSAYVNIVDGYPDWMTVTDYTYVWKNSAGTILAGYPKTTSETTDTVYNLGVDDYTIVVTDANGNVDSAMIYITDCLYRGGNGFGSSTDSTMLECYSTSIYSNSGNDGFDYVIDTPNYYNGMFCKGGDGHGFYVDTTTQDCSLSSIYTNSGRDGFDSKAYLQNCDLTFFSSGGNGSGFASNTSLQSCSTPLFTIGESGDGADQVYNGCTPLIYEFPATNNTCLEADTIYSNGSNQWQKIMLNGQLVAEIKDNGNNLGEITTQFYINDNAVRIDPFGILPSYYLDRNFNIAAENLIFGNAVRMRLYFVSNELQALIKADNNVTSINSLGVTQYFGSDKNCTIVDNIDNNDSFDYAHISTYDWDTYENGYFIEFDLYSLCPKT